MAFVDRPPEDGHEASVRAVTQGLFDTMQIPIVRGRPFEARDTTDGQPVAIVNQTFAERFFPDGDAIGQQVKRGGSEDDSPWRTVVGIAGDVAGTALALAVIGIHGVIAYTVGQRTREIGIRVALGATRAEVLALVVGQGLRLAVIGVLLGLAGAYTGARALDTLLFGVTTTDPATFVTVTAVLLAVAAGACFVAARPATSADPAVALRQE